MAANFLLLQTLFSLLIITINQAKGSQFATNLNPNLYRKPQANNLTHLHFYMHDIYSGSQPTATVLVRPPSGSNPAGFGAVSMIDDPLTEGPEMGSRLVGRAQGLYAMASQSSDPNGVGLMMSMNLVLLDEAYNGSYVTVLGRNEVFDKVREMPVVGGSGVFRFSTGYAQASTYSFNTTSGDAVVEYNVYVLH